jgi:hypothetical protein
VGAAALLPFLVLTLVATLIVYGLLSVGFPVTWFTVYWVYWLVVGFGVPEFLALRTKTDGDLNPRSLSRNTWMWFAITGKGKGAAAWRIRRLALLVLMAWLSMHFLTGGYV